MNQLQTFTRGTVIKGVHNLEGMGVTKDGDESTQGEGVLICKRTSSTLRNFSNFLLIIVFFTERKEHSQVVLLSSPSTEKYDKIEHIFLSNYFQSVDII